MASSDIILDKKHKKRVESIITAIKRLYDKATARFIELSKSSDYDGKAIFSFSKYKDLSSEAENIVKSLSLGINQAVMRGTGGEWERGTGAASLATQRVLKAIGVNETELATEARKIYFDNNKGALAAFQARKIGNGQTLSSRIWDIANQHKLENELAISVTYGTSADETAKEIQKLLNEPERLYRRVRDEYGELQLSKHAKQYNPGGGVYRSSYKNAMRLARTEINMAYRNSELESYKEMDYVVGYEVHRSTHDYNCDLCESLKGKYPKSFKFNGWHPQCRCFITPILITEEEMAVRRRAIIEGEEFDTSASKNAVNDAPDGFYKWVNDNKERIESAESRGTLPYFLKDNKNFMDVGLSYDSKDSFARRVDNTLGLLSQEDKVSIEKIVDANAPAPVVSASISDIANNLQKGVSHIEDDIRKRSTVIDSLFSELYSDSVQKGDPNYRISLINKIKDKTSVLTQWELRRSGAVDGLEYVGFERNHVFLPKQSMEVRKTGQIVNIEKYQKDVVKYRDSFGREFWYPLGANKDNIPVRANEASRAIGKMFPGMQKYANKLFFDIDYHPIDKFYQLDYANFTHGAMYSGTPISVHMKPDSMTSFIDTLCHEIGHKIDVNDKYSGTVQWYSAYIKESPVSQYSVNHPREDFAEHFRALVSFLIGGHTQNDNLLHLQHFRKKYPERYKVLESIVLDLMRS